mmetsp:Transcript_8033/g.10213  ORF Transcript_8033/g.10213 Transcript_8033/m.10213 type:complete len:390 (-) Transcript_8033:97-1266(-)
MTELIDSDEECELFVDNENIERTRYRRKKHRMAILICMGVLSLVLGLTVVHVAMDYNRGPKVLFQCPAYVDKSLNDNKENLVEWYDELKLENEVITTEDDQDSQASSSSSEGDYYSIEQPSVYPVNMTDDEIDKLKNQTYDGSSWTYNEFKEVMFDWKKRYAKLLKSGDKIFESACGIGMNLLMTVDVLLNSSNIDLLEVYGIEYRASSTADANNLLGQLLPKTGNATLGADICRGDATDLFFVPSDSFDLAFTGYIDPVQDPLNLEEELGREVEWGDLCEDIGESTENGKRDQAAVEEWYAMWVTELVRIAKPGKVVAIEQVSLPTCDEKYDWGGVARGWWNRAVMKYDWDINMFSIAMTDVYTDPENKKNRRYNVYMEKKAPKIITN